MAKHLIIRADASTRMGSGHLMRCLALAEAWAASGRGVTVVSACTVDALCERVRAAGYERIPVEQPHPAPGDLAIAIRAASAHDEPAVVVDGYHFDAAYLAGVADAGFSVLAIDDYAHAESYPVDIILNQNPGAEDLPYRGAARTRFLLGPRYALLRGEFARWRTWQRAVPAQGRRVLVSLGGSDPANATGTIVDALALSQTPGLEAVIVAGAASPHIEELRQAVGRAGGALQLVHDVADMAERMAWADVAVSAGGTTCWELAFMGLPNAVVVIAENQAPTARALAHAGVSLFLGDGPGLEARAVAGTLDRLLGDKALRSDMSRRGRALVDGQGAQRVADTLIELPGRRPGG
ncbi:MAG: UDP-2,4-diacetamido-2,4,6-trideoxy-beta-L-altropyranose hydrolase [Candidatus Hydrogenedentes bacterium]|nr:UDP-2,4-diacetamido-2,4,6-trideoxy-beta-L-altropyranose hydrolase [Candidatus Hydrogenedentota bacterium]